MNTSINLSTFMNHSKNIDRKKSQSTDWLTDEDPHLITPEKNNAHQLPFTNTQDQKTKALNSL